jgi:hypothetical protein
LNEDFDQRNRLLVEQADLAILEALNGAVRSTPLARINDVLRRFEQQSATVNAAWQDEYRFYFEVIDLAPALLVHLHYMTWETFSFFAVPQRGHEVRVNTRWRKIEPIASQEIGKAPWQFLGLYPLQQGPSHRVRFLAANQTAACDIGRSISYAGYEWDSELGHLTDILKLDGVLQADGDASEVLKTEGSVISLPYCWESAVDSGITPELCAVQSYDLTHDRVRFAGVTYKQPDLVALTKAIEHAAAHDYPAVRAYCGSDEVAQQLVRDLPSGVASLSSPEITPLRPGRKRIRLGLYPDYEFEIEQQGDRWLVVAFRIL